jgi:hypothetical protein
MPGDNRALYGIDISINVIYSDNSIFSVKIENSKSYVPLSRIEGKWTNYCM